MESLDSLASFDVVVTGAETDGDPFEVMLKPTDGGLFTPKPIQFAAHETDGFDGNVSVSSITTANRVQEIAKTNGGVTVFYGDTGVDSAFDSAADLKSQLEELNTIEEVFVEDTGSSYRITLISASQGEAGFLPLSTQQFGDGTAQLPTDSGGSQRSIRTASSAGQSFYLEDWQDVARFVYGDESVDLTRGMTATEVVAAFESLDAVNTVLISGTGTATDPWQATFLDVEGEEQPLMRQTRVQRTSVLVDGLTIEIPLFMTELTLTTQDADGANVTKTIKLNENFDDAGDAETDWDAADIQAQLDAAAADAPALANTIVSGSGVVEDPYVITFETNTQVHVAYDGSLLPAISGGQYQEFNIEPLGNDEYQGVFHVPLTAAPPVANPDDPDSVPDASETNPFNDVEVHYGGKSVKLELDAEFELTQIDLDNIAAQLLALGAGTITLTGTAGADVLQEDGETGPAYAAPWTFTIPNYDPLNPVLVKFPGLDTGVASSITVQTVEIEDEQGEFSVDRDPDTNNAVISPANGVLPGAVPTVSPYQTLEQKVPRLVEKPVWADLDGDGTVEKTGETDWFEDPVYAADGDLDSVKITGAGEDDYFLIGHEIKTVGVDAEGNPLLEKQADTVQIKHQHGQSFDRTDDAETLVITIRGIDTAVGDIQTVDVIEVNGGAGDDSVIAGFIPNSTSILDNDIITARAADDMVFSGGEGNDRIVGTRFADTIYTGAGEDTVTGGEGEDTFGL